MGTNYYKVKPKNPPFTEIKKTMESFDELVNKLTDEGYITEYEIDNFFSQLKEFVIEEVHLGKRSGGWQFIWNHNNKKYYEDNLESIKRFLSNGEGWIEDEYGERFTVEDFLNEEVGASMYNDPKRFINGRQYDEREKCMYEYERCATHEYTSKDGLRFSTSTEFS